MPHVGAACGTGFARGGSGTVDPDTLVDNWATEDGDDWLTETGDFWLLDP
jgi:hypothetical protein